MVLLLQVLPGRRRLCQVRHAPHHLCQEPQDLPHLCQEPQGHLHLCPGVLGHRRRCLGVLGHLRRCQVDRARHHRYQVVVRVFIKKCVVCSVRWAAGRCWNTPDVFRLGLWMKHQTTTRGDGEAAPMGPACRSPPLVLAVAQYTVTHTHTPRSVLSLQHSHLA